MNPASHSTALVAVALQPLNGLSVATPG